VFGWRSGSTVYLDCPESAVNNWSNNYTVALFAKMAASYAQTYQPEFLFLGNENDFYLEQVKSSPLPHRDPICSSLLLCIPCRVLISSLPLERNGLLLLDICLLHCRSRYSSRLPTHESWPRSQLRASCRCWWAQWMGHSSLGCTHWTSLGRCGRGRSDGVCLLQCDLREHAACVVLGRHSWPRAFVEESIDSVCGD
jgi:hypothetical protein